jgi:tetratricopeptide (TPR) repeat protein
MSDVLSQAVALHQAGRLADAAGLYQSILAQQPDHTDALRLLGLLLHQQGQHARAVELIGRAAALRPNVADYHADLAEAYRALGQHERAIGCCRTALRLQPDAPEVLCRLGLAVEGLGRNRFPEAVEHFRHALRLEPDYAPAHNFLGFALREIGRADEALTHFRRAVALAPNFPSARANLGRSLVEMGRPAEALPHCREAVRLRPDVAVLHHVLGKALQGLGQFAEANAAYLEAVRLAPNFAQVHADLGLLLRRQGRLREALPWLQRATELDERNADFWQFRGDTLWDLSERAAALPCWQRVLALDPRRAGAHLGLAYWMAEEGRLDEAQQHYRTALQLQPNLAAAQLGMGDVYEALGELAQAEAAYRAALRLQPTYALPHARLAKMLVGRLPDADRAALEQRLADPELLPELRATLLFALGLVLDARGDWAGAAAAATRANAILQEVARERRNYDSAQHEQFVDGVLRVFDRDFFERVSGLGLPARRPVFVIGLPRSGTTLIEQILASHPSVHGAGELRFSLDVFCQVPVILGRSGQALDAVPHLDGPAIRRLAEDYLKRLQAVDGGRAERLVDKMPDNYMYLGFLAVLFPQATFIHCRRDLRDVAVSCWLTDFSTIPWANTIDGIAVRFRQYRRLMEHWNAVRPTTIHEVSYEETVADLEGTARRLIAACGLDWNPACLEFHRTRRPVRTASLVQVRQPIYTRSIGRWKNYATHLADLFAALPPA